MFFNKLFWKCCRIKKKAAIIVNVFLDIKTIQTWVIKFLVPTEPIQTFSICNI